MTNLMKFSLRSVTTVCVLICSMGWFTAPLAQERAAAGAQDRQMTWKALSDMATAADNRITELNTRVAENVECGKRGLLYVGKGAAGADTLGCVVPAYDSTILNKFIACGNNNQVYSQTSDSCRSTSSSQVSANCRLETISTGNGKCPAGYSSFGTVFAGYAKSGFHDGCETCNPIYTTTCGRSVCQ